MGAQERYWRQLLQAPVHHRIQILPVRRNGNCGIQKWKRLSKCVIVVILSKTQLFWRGSPVCCYNSEKTPQETMEETKSRRWLLVHIRTPHKYKWYGKSHGSQWESGKPNNCAKKLRNDKLKTTPQSRTSGHHERLLKEKWWWPLSDFPQGKLIISLILCLPELTETPWIQSSHELVTISLLLVCELESKIFVFKCVAFAGRLQT